MTPSAAVRLLPAIALAALASAAGCREQPAKPWVLVASGDTQGLIVPCGCTSNQSGGLLRRGAYVEELRETAGVLLVDVGGAPGGTSRYDRLLFEAILRGEQLMGVEVHNIGQREAALGADYLRQVSEEIGVALLSTNVRDAAGNTIALEAYTTSAGDGRLLVLGVMSQRFAPPDMKVEPPREAVLNALATHGQKGDRTVVLAYVPEGELRELAAALPEVDVIIGGPTGQPEQPRMVGPVLVLSATNKGKFLARLDVPRDGQPWSGQIVELDERFADEAVQKCNLNAMRSELARFDIAANETAFVDRFASTDDRVAGSESCKDCHAEEYRLWRASAHAHAWASLEGQWAHVDPACQRCHVTGYGLAGGFASAGRSPDRVDVGCESCHGPSARHVHDVKQQTPRYRAAKAHCVTCHDAENSPQFAAEPYWMKIEHGTK
jgi:2',3'-cyclic-nucleotide 2'-phosphodiesterase (5'-nucleotidase family)